MKSLTTLGVPRDKLEPIGFGEEKPLVPTPADPPAKKAAVCRFTAKHAP